jgi:hypothetical protein
MHVKRFLSILLPATLGLAATPTPALAYMGPGIGFGAVTTAFAILGAILLGLFSILWYPIKRLVRRLRSRADTAE